MKVLAIIPARLGSSRFPGKPLAKINGVPMIEIILKIVLRSKHVSKTVVATCDNSIKSYIKSIGEEAIMTSKKHERASDRCYEALIKCQKKYKTKYDVVLMVQGDEPMITTSMINKALILMKNNKKINVINLVSKINNKKDFFDKNCVKVVISKDNKALYFSRSPIPHLIKFDKKLARKQVCIIPFRTQFLKRYSSMDQTHLEKLESIDMLRVLENGYNVDLVYSNKETFPVDTPEDLKRVSKLLKIF